MKMDKKVIAISAVLAMLVTLLPAKALAAGEDSRESIVQMPQMTETQKKTDSKIIGEIVEKREKNIKHFIKDDMTYEGGGSIW